MVATKGASRRGARDDRAVPQVAFTSETLAVVAALLALVAVLTNVVERASRRRAFRLRRERGAAGEARAEALLTDLGYSVLGRQVSLRYDLDVDGAPHPVDLRADFVVSLDDRRYVAEVKTGRQAPRLDTPATRRQLLEYRIAFDVSGVLLVDAEQETVRAVTFPLPPAEVPVASKLAWLAGGVALGLAVATALHRR